MLLRSIAYHLLFTVVIVTAMVLLSPVLLFGPRPVRWVMKRWAPFTMALHRVVTGIGHEYRGFDALPPGPYIVAMKHQSTWETFAFVTRLNSPAYVIKKELAMIPLFGWWSVRAGMIPVDRKGGLRALNNMMEAARAAVAEGRTIIIFPEGTRSAPGAPPDYKSGLGHLYRELKLPILPVALNSGLFWPRASLLHYPGTIVAEALPLIPAGLGPKEALRRVEAAIEAASDRLLVEAADKGAHLTPLAAARVAELKQLGSS